jgi:hypothetical protein
MRFRGEVGKLSRKILIQLSRRRGYRNWIGREFIH